MRSKQEKFDPNRKVRIPYICPNTGQGYAVDAELGPNNIQRAMAHAQIMTCEMEKGCPESCPLRELIREQS